MEPLKPGTPFVIRREQLPLLTRPYRAPRTPTENLLAAIWREALNLDQVGIEDRYVDLGGDSLMAAVIFSRIDAELGIHLPLVTLDRAPTIADLAARIDSLLTSRLK
ncbi:MAG: phosphopantetheine-binding protein [Stellaceae bacterium]